MAPLAVTIKHTGKVHNVQLDPELPPKAFKENVYQVTGIPVDRMKIMVKGGVLKDDSNWAKIAPKAGQSFMVLGTAGELPKAPERPIVFLEDMDDEELASALEVPVGLTNLGNTCYMNSTVQVLRAIPELQVSLGVALQGQTSSSASPHLTGLPASLRNLYTMMSRTTDEVTPNAFLDILRQVNPQFAEVDRSEKTGMGAMMGARYAQQDAEECYSQILNSLREVDVADALVPTGTSAAPGGRRKFIEQYLMGEIRRETSTAEAPDEPPTVITEKIMKIECNITSQVNYMFAGINGALNSTLTKRSPTLGRDAEYTQTSRLTRLPSYLTVHMVRFAWKADVQKKAKIMRKIKFPDTYEALDIVTPELKAKLLPASRRLQEIEKGRDERRKVRRRTKIAAESAASVPATDAPASEASTATADQGGQLEDESVYREREKAELEALIDPSIKNDIGASWSGLYDLVAIITHKGAAADSGHYMGFVKKSVFHGPPPTLYNASANTASDPNAMDTEEPAPAPKKEHPYAYEEDDGWYKFDDAKVSVFPKEKLPTLGGGGEDSSSYVLLYKSKSA